MDFFLSCCAAIGIEHRRVRDGLTVSPFPHPFILPILSFLFSFSFFTFPITHFHFPIFSFSFYHPTILFPFSLTLLPSPYHHVSIASYSSTFPFLIFRFSIFGILTPTLQPHYYYSTILSHHHTSIILIIEKQYIDKRFPLLPLVTLLCFFYYILTPTHLHTYVYHIHLYSSTMSDCNPCHII